MSSRAASASQRSTRAALGDALDTVGRALRDLSGELGTRYFGRKPPSRVLLGQWGGGRG